MSVQNEFLFQGELSAEHIDGLTGTQEVPNSSIVLADEKNMQGAVAVSKLGETRKSSRERQLTAKMKELKDQELSQREKRFSLTYGRWKTEARSIREKLKNECSEKELQDMMDTIEELESNMKRLYNDIRQKTTPNQEIRRKVDACIAVTVDLLGLMRTRLVEDEDEFDAELEKSKIRLLLNRDYARSIYGSTTTELSNHPSESSSISAKRAEAAAELAAKRAEINMEAVIDAHRQELKRLEKQKEVEVIEARLRVYSEEEARERNVKHTPLCDENNPVLEMRKVKM